MAGNGIISRLGSLKLLAGRSVASSSTVSGGIFSVIDQGIVSASNFLTGVIVGRVLSKTEFGLYMLAMTIVYLTQNLQLSLIVTPYTVYNPRLESGKLPGYTGSMVVFQLGLSVVVVGVIYFGRGALAALAGYDGLEAVLAVMSLMLLAILFKEFARQLNFARIRFMGSLFMDALAFLTQFGLIGFIIWRWGLTSVNVFYAMGAACAVASLVWFLGQRGHVRIEISRLTEDLKTSWRFGRWPLLAGMVLMLTNQIYPWVLSGFHGASATGELAAVIGIINVINPLVLGVGNFIGPKVMHSFAEGGLDRMSGFVTRSGRFLIAAMSLFCLVMFVVGGFAVRLVYGPDYAGLGLVVGLMSVGLAADVVTFPYRAGILAMERPEVNVKINVAQLSFIVILAFALIPSLGKLGVGVCMATGNILACIFRMKYYGKELRIREAAV